MVLGSNTIREINIQGLNYIVFNKRNYRDIKRSITVFILAIYLAYLMIRIYALITNIVGRTLQYLLIADMILAS